MMKPCPECGLKFKNIGLAIHRAREHGVHTTHEEWESQFREMKASKTKVCPVPGCGQEVGDLQRHLCEMHEEWRLSNGRFVFEVA